MFHYRIGLIHFIVGFADFLSAISSPLFPSVCSFLISAARVLLLVMENLFTTQKVMLPLIWRIDPGQPPERDKQLWFHSILFSNRVLSTQSTQSTARCTQQRHIKRIFEGNHEFSQLPLLHCSQVCICVRKCHPVGSLQFAVCSLVLQFSGSTINANRFHLQTMLVQY